MEESYLVWLCWHRAHQTDHWFHTLTDSGGSHNATRCRYGWVQAPSHWMVDGARRNGKFAWNKSATLWVAAQWIRRNHFANCPAVSHSCRRHIGTKHVRHFREGREKVATACAIFLDSRCQPCPVSSSVARILLRSHSLWSISMVSVRVCVFFWRIHSTWSNRIDRKDNHKSLLGYEAYFTDGKQTQANACRAISCLCCRVFLSASYAILSLYGHYICMTVFFCYSCCLALLVTWAGDGAAQPKRSKHHAIAHFIHIHTASDWIHLNH